LLRPRDRESRLSRATNTPRIHYCVTTCVRVTWPKEKTDLNSQKKKEKKKVNVVIETFASCSFIATQNEMNNQTKERPKTLRIIS
jgi:hypothetical protein